MICIISGVSLWDTPCYYNMLNYGTIKQLIFFDCRKILTFAPGTNLVREVSKFHANWVTIFWVIECLHMVR